MIDRDLPNEVKSAGWNEMVLCSLKGTLITPDHDLLWAVDKDMKIILANEAFKQFVYELTGEMPRIDDPVLSQVDRSLMNMKWTQLYERALLGEKFNVITSYMSSVLPILLTTSFIPIVEDNKIIAQPV